MFEVPLLIGEREAPASGGATFTRANPVTGAPASRAAAATAEDARAAVDAAAAAFPAWSAIGPTERRGRLLHAADLLAARMEEFAGLMREEIGATQGWAAFNVGLATSMLREAAALTTMVTGEVIPSDVPGSMAMAIRRPVGVVASMAPWNAPVILSVRSMATPLACGNTVVFKSSEICPATHRLVGSVLAEAGLGDGIVNVVSHAPDDAPEVVGALIAHPEVRRVSFTGSTKVGRIIAKLAAEHLKPAVLELGGKAPLVVLDDADLDAAVDAATFGALLNSGQICMSTERIIVDESVADDFVAKLVARVEALPVGDPAQGDVVLGAVSGQATVDRIARLVGEAVDQGATVCTGGSFNGTIMAATVVDHVTPAMTLFREESFGPSVSVTRVPDTETAVRLANDTEYGLAAAVFGRDVGRAVEVASRIDSGICHVNGPTVHDEAQMPFGGIKASGWGRFGGRAGIQEFTDLRWITVQTGPRQYPF
jgi:benzaldehyde dehydrogenase (NAD)